MKFLSLLNHSISVLNPDTQDILFTLEKSGVVARLLPVRKTTRTINLIQVKVFTNRVLNLPEPTRGITFVVSNVVAQTVCRTDVVSPATGPHDCLRGEGNQIIGVYRFQNWEKP